MVPATLFRISLALLAIPALLVQALMGQMRTAKPSDVGLSGRRLEQASSLLRSEVERGRLGAAAILVARRGAIALHEAFGRMSPEPDAPPVKPDSVFLLASITKPVTATAVMILVERGQVSLDDPVSRYLPEFRGGERERVLVRHLLSHTSGLPDMLPENLQLRRAHAPLSEFVRRTCATPLLFTPGSRCSYQSMGTLLAGEIVQRVTGERLRDFLRREIFRVLGMKDSALGLGKRRVSETVWSSGPPEASKQDLAIYGWSTEYWRDLGAPWGGMHGITTDLAILLQTFLNGGSYDGRRLLKPETAQAMITDQNRGVDSPWGLGWALAGSRAWNYFGTRVSPGTFGHVGATGTIAWADPEKELICVVLTNRPVDVDKGRLLRRVSEAVASAAE